MGIVEGVKKDTPTSQLGEQNHQNPHDNSPIFAMLPVLTSTDVVFSQSEQKSAYYCIFRNPHTRRSNYRDGTIVFGEETIPFEADIKP